VALLLAEVLAALLLEDDDLVIALLLQDLGREPTVDEVAAKVDLSPDRVRDIQRIALEPLSLETPVGEEDDSFLGDFVADDSAISPDGRTVVMIGVKDGVRQLFARRLDHGEATELPDTNGANSVAFSPDGASLVFVPGSGLVTRLSLSDLQRKVVASGADLTGTVAWSSAGIVFGRNGALWIVSPEGGAPRALTVLDAGRHEVLHARPEVLPGGRFVLFASLTTEPGTERIELNATVRGRGNVTFSKVDVLADGDKVAEVEAVLAVLVC